jgi:hypothetical protein
MIKQHRGVTLQLGARVAGLVANPRPGRLP